MSRWFRHYAGMCRDEKLVSAAIKSKQPIERVVWVYGAILESAAEVDDDGRYDFDADEAAYFLRADAADILAVVSALETSGRLASSRVVKWGDRQFSSDRSKNRVAAYRERKRSQGIQHDVEQTSQNDDVTLQSRYGNAPETETDKEDTSLRSVSAPKRENPFSAFDGVLTDETAKAVVAHRKAKKAPLTMRSAQLLAKAFTETGEPERAAEMMLVQGWQGFKPEWFAKARAGPLQQQRRGSAAMFDALDRMIPDEQPPNNQAIPASPVRLLSGSG